MNLHSIVGPIIAAVNPTVSVSLQTGTGSTTQADGTVVPNYSSVVVPAQIQALTSRDLRQLYNLNLQGTQRAIYFYGDVSGVLRASQTNGTLVTFPDGSVWMVFSILEPWSTSAGWTKVAVVQQNRQ